MGWVGLVYNMLWVGLGFKKLTHVHVCVMVINKVTKLYTSLQSYKQTQPKTSPHSVKTVRNCHFKTKYKSNILLANRDQKQATSLPRTKCVKNNELVNTQQNQHINLKASAPQTEIPRTFIFRDSNPLAGD